MQYKLRGENDFSNPIETILKNRNITEDLFHLTEEVIENYNNYDNISVAIETFLEHINNKNNIAILVDEDCDGLTSSAILYRYIKDVFNYPNLKYIMHTKKAHGLSKDIIIPEETNLILIPDASSNDYKQHQHYKEKGVDIIVLDHHPAEKISEYAIVVNNRLSKNVNNENFSGVGVTYKFLKALDDYLFEDKADQFLDLLAVGNVADVIDLKEKETRYLCYKGIENINNTFLKALIESNSYELENKYNITKIGWVIAPKLNGTIRSGTYEVKEQMFKAFITDDYSFALEVAEKCKVAKRTQDNAVKKIMPIIEEQVDIQENDKCIILEAPKNLQQSHTGLVANKLQEKYGVPVILYRDNDKKTFSGNTRGNINITSDFKKDLTESKLFVFCEGQPNAFGVSFNKKNLHKIKDYLNELYKDKPIITGKTYEVDLILTEDNVYPEIIDTIASYENEWGNGLPEPLILFRGLTINITEENLKGKKNPKTMVFECNGVKFAKKFLSNVIKDSVLNKGYIQVNLIGKCTINTYDNTGQVEVIDIEVI